MNIQLLFPRCRAEDARFPAPGVGDVSHGLIEYSGFARVHRWFVRLAPRSRSNEISVAQEWSRGMNFSALG